MQARERCVWVGKEPTTGMLLVLVHLTTVVPSIANTWQVYIPAILSFKETAVITNSLHSQSIAFSQVKTRKIVFYDQ